MPENTIPSTGSCWFYAQPMEVSASSTAKKFPKPAGLYDPLPVGNISREEALISTSPFFSMFQGSVEAVSQLSVQEQDDCTQVLSAGLGRGTEGLLVS